MRNIRFPKRKKQKSSLKRKVFGGLFFCLLAGLIYFFVFSPYLWIEEIDVRPSGFNKIKEIVQENLENKLWQLIPQKSIVLVPVDKIKDAILDGYPKIRSVTIYRKMPNILEVEIEEREKIGIWCQLKQVIDSSSELATSTVQHMTDKCFYIDKEGVIYKESPLIISNLVLNIYSRQDEPAKIKSEVVSPELIDFILTIWKELPKIKTAAGPLLIASDFEIVSIEDLRATTSQGWQIYLNPAYSANTHLKTLQMVLDEEIKEDHLSLEYIDLRIQGRAYYK